MNRGPCWCGVERSSAASPPPTHTAAKGSDKSDGAGTHRRPPAGLTVEGFKE